MNKLIGFAAAGILAFTAEAGATSRDFNTEDAQMQLVVAHSKQRLGTLTCRVAGGVGFIIGSSKRVDCVFKRRSGPSERYVGSIGKFGLDIGVSGRSYLSWLVYTANASDTRHGALSGDYVGASAGASLGLGLGANALIGGTAKNFGLQPLSAQTGTGLNVAAGVASLHLEAAK